MTYSNRIPKILPVPQGTPRPFWSVMIPTYNCAQYLEETLQSVLRQDPGPEAMQITVVDDGSVDDPESVAKKIGRGRVEFYRQSRNIGATRNFNTCIELSRGYWVHILHGDDFVVDGFYEALKGLSVQNPQASLLACRSFQIDQHGLWVVSPRVFGLMSMSNNSFDFLYENPLNTPAVVIKREFYEKWGGFHTKLIHTADWEMWVRAIRRGGGCVVNKPLAYYRITELNHSNQVMATGENLTDLIQLGKIFKDRLKSEFDWEKFYKMIQEKALSQAEFFGRCNKPEAAEANLLFWKRSISIKSVLKEALQDLAKCAYAIYSAIEARYLRRRS